MRAWLGLCLLLGGCFQDTSPQRSAFLPLGYRTAFLTVRQCRQNAAHSNNYQRVLANAVAADPYTAQSFPLPAGSVVVAEQHQEPSCSSLIGFYLMAKENLGYDTANHDWHWQVLDVNERVSQDGRLAACASCHALSPCRDYLCAPP